MKNYLKYNQSKKKVTSTTEETKETTTVTIYRKLFPYIVALVCATLFYSHQFIPKRSERYTIAQKEHRLNKKERTKILIELIESTKGTDIYNKFQLSKNKTDKAWEVFLEAKKDEKVFGFASLRYFTERFGLILCFFLYSLYNIVNSFLRDKKNKGAIIIHTLIISLCFFSFYWIFQSFQDLNRVTYYLMTVFAASMVSLAVYLLTKYNKDKITKLREQMFTISIHAYRNAKPEKKKETFQMLKKIAHDK
ncbi:conserved membrane protein of unknown function [Tenacibaculum sp. 190524A02b]|uniref:hypothetical protein n=1 Tax=Tenacibaculum vairaonense TaxID=3137860 RepID=UPI0032B2DE0D